MWHAAVSVAALALVVGAIGEPTRARSESLDGITIIEVRDESVRDVLTGASAGSASHIVTFVSAAGTYAVLGDRTSRLCIAWARDGSYTGRSVTFGLEASEQSLKAVHPQICQPFTLTLAGGGRVRIEAANRHGRSGPLAPDANVIPYSGEHDVLARVPLVAFDWGMEVFSRYNVGGVRLGPLPAIRVSLGNEARFDLGPLQRSSSGAAKSLRITMPRTGRSERVSVNGRVAAAEVLTWPWDVLYAATYQERLSEKSLTEAFDRAVADRYGPPARSVPGIRAGTRMLQWFSDLHGQPLSASSAGTESCMATADYWIGREYLDGIDGDIGPWGCALILTLVDDGADGTVEAYSVGAVSGYVMALNRFLMRVDELERMRRTLDEVQGFRSKL